MVPQGNSFEQLGRLSFARSQYRCCYLAALRLVVLRCLTYCYLPANALLALVQRFSTINSYRQTILAFSPQPGARYRSWDAARQARFQKRMTDMLLDPRCTKEVRRIWVSSRKAVHRSVHLRPLISS